MDGNCDRFLIRFRCKLMVFIWISISSDCAFGSETNLEVLLLSYVWTVDLCASCSNYVLETMLSKANVVE